MIYELNGDCTKPIKITQHIIIPQINNDLGIAGSGLVMAIKEKWPKAIEAYELWSENGYHKQGGTKIPFKLGQTQLIKVEDNIYVANMIAQSGIGYYQDLPPIRYQSLEECLLRLKDIIKDVPDHSLHLGQIGAARAGGDLNIIKSLLNKVFPDTIMYMYAYNGKFK